MRNLIPVALAMIQLPLVVLTLIGMPIAMALFRPALFDLLMGQRDQVDGCATYGDPE